MADKEATLKLTLKSEGFKAGLTDAEKAAKKAGTSMGKELSKGLSEAGKAGFDALRGSLANLKSMLTGIAGIGAGVGIVDFARRAISSEAAFRKLSFQIKAGTGELVAWRDIQREAQATALKFGHTSEEVGKSISDLYASVGDPKFAREASKVVAEFATGAHESIETVTNLAGGLNEKFGITAKELPEVLANVVSLGNKGGVSVEDLAEKIGIIGANARGAGLQGKKGFELLVGMLNIADNATGTLKKGIGGVTGIIEGITNNTLGESLKKNLGFDLAAAKKQGLEFDDILGRIIEKSGGKHDNLAKVFSGDSLKVVSELARVYQDGFDRTQGSSKEKAKGAWQAYEQAIADASKSAVSVKDIQEEAAREMETPEKKIATALEKLAQTFTSEKFSAAFQQLGEFLPKVVDQIMKHPMLTGALLSGVPSAVAGGLAKSLAESISKSMGGFFKGSGGAAVGIGVAALGAYEAGKAIIDAKLEEDAIRQDNTRAQGFASANSLSASRTTTATDRGAFRNLAEESSALVEDLARRVELASSSQGYKVGRRFNAGANRWEDVGSAGGGIDDQMARRQADAALPGGSASDRDEWAARAIEQAKADFRNIDSLRQALEDARQANANWTARASGTYGQLTSEREMLGAAGFTRGVGTGGIGVALSGVSDEQYGLGLGSMGGYKSNRQKAQEAAQAQEEARVAAQKQDFAGLIDGITAPLKGTLLARIVNPEDFKSTDLGKGADPK